MRGQFGNSLHFIPCLRVCRSSDLIKVVHQILTPFVPCALLNLCRRVAFLPQLRDVRPSKAMGADSLDRNALTSVLQH
jgi:hypothetical protein